MRAVLRTIAFARRAVSGWRLGSAGGATRGAGRRQQVFAPTSSSTPAISSSARSRAGSRSVIEKAISNWGQPNGYVLGQEAGGAFVAGLRYGEGTLYTKNAGDLRVFWQGPSVGFDFGGEGARTMMLVYNLPRDRCGLSALRRHRRLGLFHRRLRHDGADRQQHRGGSDPLRRRVPAGRQCRLSEVHRRTRPGTRSEPRSEPAPARHSACTAAGPSPAIICRRDRPGAGLG